MKPINLFKFSNPYTYHYRANFINFFISTDNYSNIHQIPRIANVQFSLAVKGLRNRSLFVKHVMSYCFFNSQLFSKQHWVVRRNNKRVLFNFRVSKNNIFNLYFSLIAWTLFRTITEGVHVNNFSGGVFSFTIKNISLLTNEVFGLRSFSSPVIEHGIVTLQVTRRPQQRFWEQINLIRFLNSPFVFRA